MCIFSCVMILTKVGERRGGIPGARTGYWGPKYGKTSGHWCYCEEGWGPVMRNHLLVLGPDSRFV